MKSKVVIILSIIMIGVIVVLLFNKAQFSSNFVTDILLKYKYEGENIEEKLDDKKEIESLKFLLNGTVSKDSPSCGFSTDISIIVISNEKTVILCPALDGCAILRIDESNKYISISDSNRKKMDYILKKHGYKFPSL